MLLKVSTDGTTVGVGAGEYVGLLLDGVVVVVVDGGGGGATTTRLLLLLVAIAVVVVVVTILELVVVVVAVVALVLTDKTQVLVDPVTQLWPDGQTLHAVPTLHSTPGLSQHTAFAA
jgi:hypothetical protein